MEAIDKLKERDDLVIELLKMKTQLETLSHSHQKLSESMAEKDETGLELSKKNAILESAVQQRESRLKEREKAFENERQLARSREEEALEAKKRRTELEQRLSEEKLTQRQRHTAELEQTKAASDKNRLLEIRQARMDIEDK